MSYKLIHGDCLEVMPTLESVDAVITDPPYGINFDTDYTRFTGGNSQSRNTYLKIANDDKPFDPSPFIGKQFTSVLFGANNYSDKLPQGSWLVWDKRQNGKPLMTSDGEVAWCSRGHGVYIYNHVWDGFLRGSEQGIDRFHPTQKPIKLMEWIIEKYTKKGDTILDPFMGSGTTGVACMRTGRNFIGIEINADYFAIAQRRIEEATYQPSLFTPQPSQWEPVTMFGDD